MEATIGTLRNAHTGRKLASAIEVRMVEEVTEDMDGGHSSLYVNPGTIWTGIVKLNSIHTDPYRRVYSKDLNNWFLS